MSTRRVRAAALLLIAPWLACNGRLEFDVPADAGVAGARDSGAETDSGELPAALTCDACERHGLRCTGEPPTCVECVDDDDCGGRHAHCDPALHRCTECNPNAGCDRGRVCDGWSRTCVQSCAPAVDPDEDCGGTRLICDRERSLCVECQSDADCVGSPAGSHCPPGGAHCALCSTDAECGASAPLCDPLTFTCVGCADSRDCPNGQLCDPTLHACLAI
jgi:Cys-rich repeat protein